MPRFLLYLSLVLVLPKVRNVRAAYGVDSVGNWDCQGATVTATHTKRCVRDSGSLRACARPKEGETADKDVYDSRKNRTDRRFLEEPA